MSAEEEIFAILRAKAGLKRLRATLFDRQLAFIEHPAKRKTGRVGRRGGKSTAAAVDLLHTGLDGRPGVSFYCTITRERAKAIMWGPLKTMNRVYDLGFKMNESELVAYGPNDARIVVTGADKMKEADKKRGDKYKVAYIDEAGSLEEFLEEMIEEVVAPACMDYNATIAMVGSPNKSCEGYFHDADTGSKKVFGWTPFHWTALKNPYLEDVEAYFKQERDRKGLTADDPDFLREYMGLWIKGGRSLLYKYDDAINLYDGKREPNHDWQYVIGVDLGFFPDPSAFVVWAFHEHDPNLYECESLKADHLIPEQVAAILERLRESYSQNARIVVDTGGLGKMIAEGLQHRFGKFVIAAKKTEKLANIEIMNGDIVRGRIKVKKNSPLVKEWMELHLTEDGVEDRLSPNHLADAALYAHRYSTQFLAKEPPSELTPTQREELRLTEMIERHQRQRAEEDDLTGLLYGDRTNDRDLWQ